MRIIDEQKQRITFNKFIFLSIKIWRADAGLKFKKIEWNILTTTGQVMSDEWTSLGLSRTIYIMWWKKKNLYLTNEEVGGFPPPPENVLKKKKKKNSGLGIT